MVNHLFLQFGNLSELAAGGDDQFEFIRGVYGTSARWLGAEDTVELILRTPHDVEKGAGQGEEDFHRRRDREGDLLGALQGQRLGNQFP